MTFRHAWTALPLALCCLGVPAQEDPQALGALQKTMQAQAAALSTAEARLTSLEQYLAAQATAAQNFLAATESAQKAGFVAGINPASREILMRAWADRTQAQTENLPAGATSSASPRAKNKRN